MSEREQDGDLSYEQALELFDAQLRALEEGDLTLEQAIEAVDKGRRYLKMCEAKLEAARQKIEVRPDAASDLPPPPEDRLL